jgi:hypothetical protein
LHVQLAASREDDADAHWSAQRSHWSPAHLGSHVHLHALLRVPP